MIDISTVPNVAAATTNLIYGALKDDIVPGDGEGTPVRKDWQSDPYYALIAVMNAAGIVADNSPEGATSSQFLTALRKVVKDTQYPVGSFYVQYPDAASNTDATAFPTSARPATMFGGTWVEQFNTENVFFRTAGTDYQTRSSGLSADQVESHKHGLNGKSELGTEGITSTNYISGQISGGGSYMWQATTDTVNTNVIGVPITDGVNTLRTGAVTEPRNRLVKIWKRTVL